MGTMTSLLRWIGAFGIVALCAGVGLYLQTPASQASKEKKASRHLTASVQTLHKSTLENWLTAPGKITAKKRVAMVFQNPGQIAYIGKASDGSPLRLGSWVKGPRRGRRGQLIARLDTREARAAMKVLQASVRATRETLRSASIWVKQARSSQKLARKNWRRARSLYAKRALSRAQLEQAQHTWQQAGTQYHSAHTKEKAARAHLLGSLQRLRQMRLSLLRSELRAPFHGVIASMDLRKSQVVSGQTPSLVLLDPKSFEVRLYLTVGDALQVKRGQPAQVLLSSRNLHKKTAAQHASAQAVVKAISPAVQSQYGLVEVWLKLTSFPSWLRDGMNVVTKIRTIHKPKTLWVPHEALLHTAENKDVFVLHPKTSCVQRRKLQLGLRGRQGWEVLAGLAVGERVVSTGKHRLFHGACIRPLQIQ